MTLSEAKSVAHALANEYWGQGLKKKSKQYHTKFEVMIPLARHLKKFKLSDDRDWTDLLEEL